MDNSKNMEPGIRNTAVQDSPNKEQRKKEGRPAISAKAQTILDFLRGCTPYEADSIRVMVGYGTGNGDKFVQGLFVLEVGVFEFFGLGYGPQLLDGGFQLIPEQCTKITKHTTPVY